MQRKTLIASAASLLLAGSTAFAFAQDAAPRRFENRRLGAPLAHHPARARRSRIVSQHQRFIVEKHAVRAVVRRVPAVAPCAGSEQAHGRGLAVRTGDDGGRDIAQFLPGNPPDIGQIAHGKIAAAHARAECELRFIDHIRQPARRGRIEQGPEFRLRFQGREAQKAGDRRRFLEDGRNYRGWIRAFLGSLQGFRWIAPPKGHFWADPFLLDHDGRRWVFFEDYVYAKKRAFIACAELLAKGGPVGRRLDFLAQELAREANTLCAKSNDASLTAIGLELRVEIEQFREQVQNIE